MEKNVKNNEVTNFMYYMYNRWGLDEAKDVFGDNLGEHLFSKWLHYRHYTHSGDLYWYSEHKNKNRNKIVARANEIYGNE